MNSLPYPQQYPPMQQYPNNQIIRRPMTEAERQLPANFYRGLQRGLRGASLFCIILFVFNGYVLPAVVTDPITYDALSMMLTIFMVALGAVAIGMAVNTIVVRKKIGETLRDGVVVEVIAPAYRNSMMKNAQSWTVGPVSILPSRGLDGMMQEGSMTSILCVPRMKVAIAINGFGLKQGARISFPPNLEAMAVPMNIGTPVEVAPVPAAPPVEAHATQVEAPQTAAPAAEPSPEVPAAKRSSRSHKKKASAKHHGHRSA